MQRGADGWLRAESGALSTGEAIGTGQAIPLDGADQLGGGVPPSAWQDIAPCRLLFLDEAARLDNKSIATLFELCERQDMQLLIAAPENISPEKGTTYKLIRKGAGQARACARGGSARLRLCRRQTDRLTRGTLTGADGSRYANGGLGLPFSIKYEREGLFAGARLAMKAGRGKRDIS